MRTGQRKLLKEVMIMQQYQQILFLVNVPKQHLIMQTLVKKMLHNMQPIPLFISTAAMESLRSSFFRSIAHTEVILANGDLQTNACDSKTIWCILIL